MGFVSPLPLKDAEGFRRNAIRSEKNLILCRPTTVDRMPDGQQPNLELTGEICEVQNCYTATLLLCYKGEIYEAATSDPTPGLSSLRQSALKTRSGQRTVPKIGKQFKITSKLLSFLHFRFYFSARRGKGVFIKSYRLNPPKIRKY